MDHIHGNYNRTEYHTAIFLHPGAESTALHEWKQKLIAILEKVPSKADIVKPVIQLIVAAINPAKIYMLYHKEGKSVGAGDYIDLLIVVSGKCGTPFTELEPVLDMAYLKDQRVSGSLHSEGAIIDGLRNGHVFYTLYCTPENLVYDDNTVAFPVTPPEALQKLRIQMQGKFNGYLKKSDSFYEAAVFLRKDQSNQITAFILHQAAELIYRGVLQSLNGYDKKTHEILSLKKYIRRCAPQLNNIFPDDTAEGKLLIDVLDKAYIGARYDEQYFIQENDLVILFEKVKLLQEAAKEIVETKLSAVQ